MSQLLPNVLHTVMLADWILVGALPHIPAETTLQTSGGKSATARSHG